MHLCVQPNITTSEFFKIIEYSESTIKTSNDSKKTDQSISSDEITDDELESLHSRLKAKVTPAQTERTMKFMSKFRKGTTSSEIEEEVVCIVSFHEKDSKDRY